MGDKRNQFPFTGSIDDSGRAFYAKKGAAPSATDDNLVRPVKSSTGVSTTLCDDEKYYISGLSKTAAVTYTETNNTEDVYQTSVTGGTPKAATAVSPEGTVSMESTNVMQAADVTFINTLQAVSPTGVVMRYGAPLSMLLLGAALAVLTRRSKKGSLA